MPGYDATGATLNAYPSADPALAGEVICGGPGRDCISILDGGAFKGGRGADDVFFMDGGTLEGGRGPDSSDPDPDFGMLGDPFPGRPRPR